MLTRKTETEKNCSTKWKHIHALLISSKGQHENSYH